MSKAFNPLLAVGLLFFTLPLKAQVFSGLSQQETLFGEADTNSMMHLYSEFEASSTHVNFNFVKSFYFGQFLSESLISENVDLLDQQNHIGASQKSGISFKSGYKSGKKSLVANSYTVSMRQEISAIYSSDLWLLAMKGNAPFAGSSIEAGHSGFRNLKWLDIAVGQTYRKSAANSKFSFSSGYHLIAPLTHFNLNTTQGNLYTDTGGAYIDIALQGNRSMSEGKLAGIGAAWNGEFRFMTSDKTEWQMSIEDLGWVFTGDKTKNNVFDTAFRFSGIYIFDIHAISENDYWNKKSDSLTSGLIGNPVAKAGFLMPAQFSLGLLQPINSKNGLGFKISYRYGMHALPLAKATHYLHLSNGFFLQSTLSYGGYGHLQWTENVGFEGKKTAIDLSLGGMHTMLSDKIPFQAAARLGIKFLL